ncbi:MAG: sulfatase [Halobacteriota archaeon]
MTGKNIVLVTFDSVRADHCGFLDPTSELTPNLDRLSERGVVFENAIAPGPRTPTSVPETFTGAPMAHTPADSNEDQIARIRSHMDTHETLPERLSDLGYTTAAFSANPWTSGETGFTDAFDDFRRLNEMRGQSLFRRAGLKLFSGTFAGKVVLWVDSWKEKRDHFSQWPAYIDDITSEMERLDEPSFVWIFLLDTHNPYIVGRADRVENSMLDMYYGVVRGNSKFRHGGDKSYYGDDLPESVDLRVRRAYRDAVRSADRFMSELWERVDTDDTLLLFNSDHGEAFGEHGSYGHRHDLYEENIHVPLVAWDGEHEGERISTPISLRTLPDMLAAYATDGVPITDEGWTADRVISRTEGGDKVAVRDLRWKYISGATEELYDLERDPGERTNVAAENQSLCAERRADVEAYLETVPETVRTDERFELSGEAQSRLETLGYVDE